MNNIILEISNFGIVPVIVIEDARNALPIARALNDGGLPVAEVTFRTKAAKESICKIAREFPQILLGAGTVLTTDQVDSAIDSGAKFIVAPGLNGKIVDYCISKNIPIVPGISTPSEIEHALQFGLEVLKFFPAEALGGLNYLKAISAPYGNLKFIPTGGIDSENLLSYLKFPKILACGGSWMVKSELIKAGRFDEIKMLTQHAVGEMLGFSLKHVGINCNSADESIASARQIAALFNLTLKEGNSSNFTGGQIEFLKNNYLGQHGHVAIGTNFIDRAVPYFERKGCRFNQDSRSEKNGKLQSIYFENEIAGFAWHLVQN
jgi:2-dehydro-3-deoxyphosphogluconate aldolase/(4S)-4-hydroxy-2-oxoglutarate aldolase